MLDLYFLPTGPLLSLVAKGGKMASLLNALTEKSLDAAGIAGTNVWAVPSRGSIGHLLQQVAEGAFRTDFQQVLPIFRAASGSRSCGRTAPITAPTS